MVETWRWGIPTSRAAVMSLRGMPGHVRDDQNATEHDFQSQWIQHDHNMVQLCSTMFNYVQLHNTPQSSTINLNATCSSNVIQCHPMSSNVIQCHPMSSNVIQPSFDDIRCCFPSSPRAPATLIDHTSCWWKFIKSCHEVVEEPRQC